MKKCNWRVLSLIDLDDSFHDHFYEQSWQTCCMVVVTSLDVSLPRRTGAFWMVWSIAALVLFSQTYSRACSLCRLAREASVCSSACAAVCVYLHNWDLNINKMENVMNQRLRAMQVATGLSASFVVQGIHQYWLKARWFFHKRCFGGCGAIRLCRTFFKTKRQWHTATVGN